MYLLHIDVSLEHMYS